MASLESQSPKDSYFGLLKTTDDASVGASKKAIVDGGQNPTGLGVSSTKVFANTLRVESAPTSSTNTNVATFNASGDVEARTANERFFSPTLSEIAYARGSNASTGTLEYVSVGTTSADSYVVGSAITINTTADVVVIKGDTGQLVEVDLTLDLNFVEVDAEGKYTINLNSAPLAVSSFQNITQGLMADSMFNMKAAFLTATTADQISVEYTATSGTVNWNSGTILKVQKVY